jgi:23S rRNA (uracil1939-C5)-methyltransferase
VSDVDLIIRIAARGDGVTGDGRHVPGSAPGDRLLSGGGLAKGPNHVAPVCRHFPECGGCQLQQLSDSAYAAYVRDRVAGALTGQGIGADDIAEAHISPPYSRRRASLRVMRLGKSIQIGFSTQASHRIVDMHECHVLEPPLVDQGVDVTLTGISPQGLEQTEALLDFARDHALARLMLDGEDGPLTLWEPDPVTVTFGSLAVVFPPRAFLQATADGEAALIAEVRAGLADAKMVADLFAGLGTFALTVADDVQGRKVYAAEAARTHVLALQSGGNRLPGRIFPEHRDLFRRPLTPKELDRFDAVVLDPPRAGAEDQARELAASTTPRIVYVSCNPPSFARDAKTLIEGGYRLESLKPVGQFRWSTHVELVGIFSRA